MRSMTATRLRRSSLPGSFAALLAVATAAAATEQQKLLTDPALVPWLTWLWVVALSAIGWAASSLATLAGWVDGSMADRLKIIQGVIASVLAGVVAFLLGKYAAVPELLVFLGVAGAGFMGEKYLLPLFQRILGVLFPQQGTPPSGGGKP